MRAGATACSLVRYRMSHDQGRSAILHSSFSLPISSSHPSAPPAQWSGALERRRRVTCARGRATSRRGGHGSIPDGLSQSAPRLGPSGSGAGGRRRARWHSHQRSVPALLAPPRVWAAPPEGGESCAWIEGLTWFFDSHLVFGTWRARVLTASSMHRHECPWETHRRRCRASVP